MTNTPLPNPQPTRQLTRDPNGKIAGVASGLAHYFAVDVTLVRLLLVALTLTAGFGPIFYLFAWMIIPESNTPLSSPGHTSAAAATIF